ncbi:MAG: Holliday junction resolvase RuvX [Fervidobacterium sp.]|nr:Holliday junction resolvase RuvX [Fervidobacterium sp.]
MRIIAVDYGKSKCGYAIGELFVSESGTVKKTEILNKISDFDLVVVGLPISMSGNYSTQSFETIRFALRILDKGKEVHFIDERLTTKMAKTYSKKDDDRFSAEQLLLEYIQNPHVAKQLKRSKIVNEEDERNSINADFALIINVPFSDFFKVKFGIAYTEDPYIAYTMFVNNIFVYRVFSDFVDSIKSTEKIPECIIINKESKELLSLGLLDSCRKNTKIAEFNVVKVS